MLRRSNPLFGFETPALTALGSRRPALNQVPAMTQEHLNILGQRLEGVMSFLQTNAAECFLPVSAYVAAADGEAAAAAAAVGGGAGAVAAAAAGAGASAGQSH
jgi:hypothetical protein